MEIKKASYLISAPNVDKCPESDMQEYAFIGRSNVGKSSLINMLTGRSALAKTSATPGKTMLINHFVINDEWQLVDLPGYGYAKRSKSQQATLANMIRGYILRRQQLTCLFVLIDIRHSLQTIDREFINWLGENEVPFAIVFTKADKLSTSKQKENVSAWLKQLKEDWEELPTYFVTSSEKSIGKNEVLSYIEEINNTAKTTREIQSPHYK